MGGWILFSHKGIIFCKEYYSAIKKEKSCHLLLMDGTWGHYAEWNKSGKERQILYDSAYKRSLKKKEKNSKKQNRLMVARGGGGGCRVMRQGSGWGCEGGPKAQTSS